MSNKLFLFRLLPPRPDFAQTMAPDEQEAMARHAAYWHQLLEAGRVVVYGPVADPEGVWGLGVLWADSQAEAVEVGQQDPVVAAGVATFDVAEIMGAITAT
ncbi:MAG: hypothetical protein JO280_18080 [Mycobacteriaceae bacterium]|nr:hypothetical protein [Mycobacteriaceae bacterium]